MKKIYFTFVLLIMLSQPSFAVENSSSDGKNHSVGVSTGVGSIRTNLHSEKSTSGSIYGISYTYQYDSTWAINAGYIHGDGFDFCIITCLPDDEMNNLRVSDYNSFILNIKGSLPLSNRWSVFGKVGIDYYKSEFSKGYRASMKDSGMGALLATGLEFRTYNGFGVAIEYMWLDMGDIYSATLMTNITYLF